MSYIV